MIKLPEYISKDEKSGYPILVDMRSLSIKYRIPVLKIKKFFDALDKGIIMATRCPVCGAKYFPPEAWCSACGYSGEMEFYPIETDGTLLTFTKIFAKPGSFSSFPDYTVGIARIDKEGFNVLAWLSDKIENPKVGMPVKLRVVKRAIDNALIYEISNRD
ncbi:Zn-ribbon domain-containing OB-fold protein [Thermoplasma volcanium]|uniref:Zn-ribbon domain-containing OB-fold protein n=1 Tax=Thermoplasma volcanium TaxID=50339 RepID=UPI0000164D1D|nr:Zn-ribbon domain-containing OB-fold protein [Thermoplasma volcanium]